MSDEIESNHQAGLGNISINRALNVLAIILSAIALLVAIALGVFVFGVGS